MAAAGQRSCAGSTSAGSISASVRPVDSSHVRYHGNSVAVCRWAGLRGRRSGSATVTPWLGGRRDVIIAPVLRDRREAGLIPITNRALTTAGLGREAGRTPLTAVSQRIPIEQTKRQLTGPAQGIDGHAGGVLRRCQPSRRAPAGHQAGPTRRPAGTAPTVAPHAFLAEGWRTAIRAPRPHQRRGTVATSMWPRHGPRRRGPASMPLRRRPSTGLQAPQHPADSAGSLRGLFSGMGEKHGPAPPRNETRGCVAGATPQQRS